jgi:hypothetical protein
MKQRLLSLTAGLCLVLSLLPTGALAADANTRLESIRATGVMVGDENGNMNLSSPVTRAQFVTMMTAASPYQGTVGTGTGTSLFKDVKSSHWASNYIKLAVEQGWMTGYVDGTFHPDQTITLEEACTALLRLLGYDASSLTGSFPTAQLSKAQAVGLLDSTSAVRGQTLTRQDCVDLFYQLLVSNGSNGMVYGTTLGYTVKNGELDYASLVTHDTKGPYVSTAAGSLSLPFSTSGITVYRDGILSQLSAVQQYDVYYYNANLRTVWVYSDRVTGTLTAVSPSRTAPTAATVAGVSYQIGTSAATYQLSSQGEFAPGDLVTLLLGMNGEIVEVIPAQSNESLLYGVVLSSAKAASTSATSTSSTGYIQTVTQVICTDGVVRTFYHSGSALSAGRTVSVSTNQSGTTVTRLSDKSLSGSVNASGTKFAGYSFADNVEILDTDSSGGYVRVYPSRLAGSTLSASQVQYYTLDANGAIDRLILNGATGDTYDYIYLTKVSNNTSGMNVSGSYLYLLNGTSRSYASSNTVFSVQTGGAALIYDDDGVLSSMRQLASVSLDQLGTLSASAGNQQYPLAENVQVLLRDPSSAQGYYATTLSQINAQDYQLTGWYDNFGCSAGGRIRIIVATVSS